MKLLNSWWIVIKKLGVLLSIKYYTINQSMIIIFGKIQRKASQLWISRWKYPNLVGNSWWVPIVEGYYPMIWVVRTKVSEIGLHDLRHSVAMIPQDPLLFSGTLQSNIDLFGMYSDADIVASLKKAHIWEDLKEDALKEDPRRRKLLGKIDEEGSNHSLC